MSRASDDDRLTFKREPTCRIADACYVPYVASTKGARMKKAVTFRFDAALLEEARRCAVSENRTLTNFIETLVKTHVASHAASAAMQDAVQILPPQPPSV
jgi:hypothetical protein